MTPHEFAAALNQLAGFARGLGIDNATLLQVVEDVNREAQASSTWGSPEQRLAEIRRRLIALP